MIKKEISNNEQLSFKKNNPSQQEDTRIEGSQTTSGSDTPPNVDEIIVVNFKGQEIAHYIINEGAIQEIPAFNPFERPPERIFDYLSHGRLIDAIKGDFIDEAIIDNFDDAEFSNIDIDDNSSVEQPDNEDINIGAELESNEQDGSDIDSDLDAELELNEQDESDINSDLGAELESNEQNESDIDSDLDAELELNEQDESDIDSDMGDEYNGDLCSAVRNNDITRIDEILESYKPLLLEIDDNNDNDDLKDEFTKANKLAIKLDRMEILKRFHSFINHSGNMSSIINYTCGTFVYAVFKNKECTINYYLSNIDDPIISLLNATITGDINRMNEIISQHEEFVNNEMFNIAFMLACHLNQTKTIEAMIKLKPNVIIPMYESPQLNMRDSILTILQTASEDNIISSNLIGAFLMKVVQKNRFDILKEMYETNPVFVFNDAYWICLGESLDKNKPLMLKELINAAKMGNKNIVSEGFFKDLFELQVFHNRPKIIKELLVAIKDHRSDFYNDTRYREFFIQASHQKKYKIMQEMLIAAEEYSHLVHLISAPNFPNIATQSLEELRHAIHENKNTPFSKHIFNMLLMDAVRFNNQQVLEVLFHDSNKDLKDCLNYQAIPSNTGKSECSLTASPKAPKLPILPYELRRNISQSGYINSLKFDANQLSLAYHLNNTSTLMFKNICSNSSGYINFMFDNKTDQLNKVKYLDLLSEILSDNYRIIRQDQFMNLLMTIKAAKGDLATPIVEDIFNYSIFNGYSDAVNFILENINAIPKIYFNAILYSLENGHTDIVLNILKSAIDKNCTSSVDFICSELQYKNGMGINMEYITDIEEDIPPNITPIKDYTEILDNFYYAHKNGIRVRKCHFEHWDRQRLKELSAPFGTYPNNIKKIFY